jgi:hypothetical protein
VKKAIDLNVDVSKLLYQLGGFDAFDRANWT